MAPGTKSKRLPATALCVLLAASSIAAAVDTQKYLLPVVNYGPNNQLRRLRYLLALAKQLNRTVILPSIVVHYLDREQAGAGFPINPRRCFKEDVPHQLEFSEILDRKYLEQWMPVTTTAEMYARGWSGSLDALAYPEDQGLGQVIRYFVSTVQGVKAQVYHNIKLIQTPNKLHCNSGAIKHIKRQLEPYNVVAIYWTIVGHTDPMYLLDEGLEEPPADVEHGCFNDLFHANRRLRANWWLRGLAQEYISRQIGRKPFMALHVRPQSDKCLKLWAQRQWDVIEQEPKDACWKGHGSLHRRVGPHTAALMGQYNISKLVVITHPKLRPIVRELLAQVGIRSPHFINPDVVYQIAGCVDDTATFLMLVEMQVAAKAKVFLGTASSSITETIVYERLSYGLNDHGFLDEQVVSQRSVPAVKNYEILPGALVGTLPAGFKAL